MFCYHLFGENERGIGIITGYLYSAKMDTCCVERRGNVASPP